MKHLVKWFLTASIFISVVLPQIDFDLPDDSASFGILICDFQTGIFEEGTVLNVQLCTECDLSSFPFDVIFLEPGDFGSIQFNYTATGDTVFYATIIWDGFGEIYYPASFFPSDSFYVEIENSTEVSIQYWDEVGNSTNDDSLLYSAQSAYELIRKLSLVHQFTFSPYQTQIIAYLYTPTVGATDWTVAKWIFFLFRNPEMISVKEDENPIPQNFKLYQPYPNPFNPTTTIRFDIGVATQRAASLRIYDITGRLVETLVNGELVGSEHEVVWNAGNLPSGVYFVRLQSGEFVENRKVILIK